MFLAGEAGFTLEVVLFLALKLKYLQNRMIPSKLEFPVSNLTGVVYTVYYWITLFVCFQLGKKCSTIVANSDHSVQQKSCSFLGVCGELSLTTLTCNNTV